MLQELLWFSCWQETPTKSTGEQIFKIKISFNVKIYGFFKEILSKVWFSFFIFTVLGLLTHLASNYIAAINKLINVSFTLQFHINKTNQEKARYEWTCCINFFWLKIFLFVRRHAKKHLEVTKNIYPKYLRT